MTEKLPYHRRHESLRPAEFETAGEWHARLAAIRPEVRYCQACRYRVDLTREGGWAKYAECERCMRQEHAPFSLETFPARLTVPLPEQDDAVLTVAARLVLWAFLGALCLFVVYVAFCMAAFAVAR
jgi:hypothetical protein